MMNSGNLVETQPQPFDHRIHLFFDFSFVRPSVLDELPKLRLHECAPKGFVHKTRIDGTSERNISDKPVWEIAPWDISLDLHPFVRSILNSSDGVAEHPHCFRLSMCGKNLFSGRYRNPSSQHGIRGKKTVPEAFRLHLSALSEKVLGFAALPLEFDDISVHLFGTGFGVAVVTLRMGLTDSALARNALVEGLPRLCDERGRPFLHWSSESGEPDESFSLAFAVAAMLEPAGCVIAKRDRVYSFCALVFDEKLPEVEKRDLAFRLSRHYNARYRPSADHTGTYFASPFETVFHAMSREGVCTIVDFVGDDAQPIEFIGTWLTQSHPRVYLPLQIAAFHEHVVLMDLAQGAGRPIDIVRSAAPDIEALRKLSARFLIFRLRYRLSQVSRLTTHDIAYAATEQALGLSALSEKIGRDLLAVEGRLIDIATKNAEFAARRVERRWALPITIGSVALALISINSFDEALKRFYKDAHSGQALPSQAALAIELLVVAVLVSVFAYRWARQRAAIGEMDRVSDREAARASLIVAK